MLRKVVVMLVLVLFISSPIAAEDILSLEDKIADFTYLYEFIEENAPYLWVNERLRGNSWLERKSEFQSWIQDTKTDLEYYERINDIIQALNSGHTDVLSPEQYINNAQAGLLQKRLLESDVKEAYKYWQELIGNSYADKNWSFTARYIAGDYWVVSSRVMEIPVGARILEVEDENIHDYIIGSGADEVLFFSYDNLRDNIYSVQLPLSRKGEVKITYELENVKEQVVVPVSVIAQHENGAIKERNNVHTEILEENKIAYIKIRSFSSENVEKDRGDILSFFHSVKDYPYIIIDIRGNTGGTDYYWKNLLIAPLIDKSIYTNFYMTYRSGNYVQEAIESFFGMGKAAMTVGRRNLNNKMQLPSEVLTHEFYDPLKLPIKVNPQNSVGEDVPGPVEIVWRIIAPFFKPTLHISNFLLPLFLILSL